MKLPPASRKASYTLRASSLGAPQPQSSPNVIAPSATSDTRSPLLPKSLYRIITLLYHGTTSGAHNPDTKSPIICLILQFRNVSLVKRQRPTPHDRGSDWPRSIGAPS